jgi:multiple sugar transport system permease protein
MSADAAVFQPGTETAVVARARPGLSPWRSRSARRAGAVVLNVVLYAVAFMCVFPFLWMLATALKPEDNALTNNFFFGYSLTWSNFSEAWNFFPFGQFMMNSFIYSFCVTAVVLVASTTGGYAFARLRFRGREKLFAVYVATLLVPAAVTVIPLFLLATKLHIYNTYLGLIFPVSFSAFGTFFMRQFFRTLPEELRDSARMDRASEFWIFARIMLPLVRAGAAVLAVFTFVAFWGDFLWPLIVTQSPSLYTLNLGLSEFQSEYGGYWSYMMVGCVLTVLPAIILVIALQKYLVKGLTFTGFGGR